MKNISTPISNKTINNLNLGDRINLSGYIYTGRDAALPKLVSLIENNKLEEYNINLNGSVIFHTAVSPAGVGPTSSNKLDIEGNIPALSKAGVKLHIGKGSLNKKTIESLKENNSVYAITPPVTALFEDRIIKKEIVAFHEEGMEALHLLKVEDFPAIIAAIHGKSLN